MLPGDRFSPTGEMPTRQVILTCFPRINLEVEIGEGRFPGTALDRFPKQVPGRVYRHTILDYSLKRTELMASSKLIWSAVNETYYQRRMAV
jgi:hypothetical protein